ncbi:MAG: glycosyltransferase family 87 protein [Candidatus Tumulicola sp.]
MFAHPPDLGGHEDFNAFYCAARIQSTGGNPYRYEPLHSCEIQNWPPITPNEVTPAPLPPYGIAVFMPLARLPFAQAGLLWWIALVASAVVTVWAIVELTELPLLLVATCTVVAMLVQALPSGALAPLCIALLSAAAVALTRGRLTLAAVLLGLACLEPQVALPPMLAAFIFLPRMRARLAGVAIAIVVVSLVTGGPALNIEYVAAVLPAHAVSELGYSAQYSLSSMLHALGFPDRAAIAAGSVQYGLFVLAGLWLARLLRRTMPESVVLVPMAFAVTGGTFIHLTQVVGALPLAFVVAARARSTAAWLGVALIATPWHSVLKYNSALPAGLILFALLAYHGRIGRAGAIVAAGLWGAAFWYLQTLEPTGSQILAIPAVPGSALAEVAWRALVGQIRPTAFSWFTHVPTYLGLLCTYWSAYRTSRGVWNRPIGVSAGALTRN